MTKIEQWQDWAKQHEVLHDKLDSATLDFFIDDNGRLDNYKGGHVKYDRDRDMLIISTNTSSIVLPVCAGKELLSVLKQLYE